MGKVVLTSAVREDLRHIALYTREKWGTPGREYLRALRETCKALEQLSFQWRTAQDAPLYKRVRYERHHIYFVVVGETIEIHRVLHEVTDPDKHL